MKKWEIMYMFDGECVASHTYETLEKHMIFCVK